jgi:hypothetical protein
MSFRRLAITSVAAAFAVSLTIVPTGVLDAVKAAGMFLASFDQVPASPTPFTPTDWDVTILAADQENIRPMVAGHGPDCAPSPGNHVITRVEETVYMCRGHIMTATNGGYSAVYLTPNAMLDFSTGESVLKFEMSTLRTSARDWVDIVIMPYESELQVNFLDVHLPKEAVHLELAGGGNVFIPAIYRNYVKETVSHDWYHNWDMILAQHGLQASDVRRDQFEVRLSRTHLKVGMPAYNLWWVDSDIAPLNWSQGVVQFNHRSYNPEKACDFNLTCRPNTWHWDNISMAPAAPFTILRADRRYVGASTSTTTVNFPAPAPADASLRFAGVGEPITLSYDGGRTWQPAVVQGRSSGKVEVGNGYRTPIPAGTHSVQFRGTSQGTIGWAVQDISIWAPGPQPAGTSTMLPHTTAYPPAPSTPQTITFDEATPNRNLEGGYPSGVAFWGADSWYVSGPFGPFSSNSLRFQDSVRPRASFGFASPRRMVKLDAFNAGTTASTLTLSCDQQPAVQASLAAGELRTILTNWVAPCTGVTIVSSNIWSTYFDNLVVDAGVGTAGTASVAAAPTPVPASPTAVPAPPTPAPAAPTPTSVPAPVAPAVVIPADAQVVTFDTLTQPNRALSGQAPANDIDWGTNLWYLSGPYGQLRTQSIGFNGAGPTSASFNLVSPKRLLQVTGFNGGSAASTVTLTCAGQAVVSATLAAGQLQTIQTRWTGPCSTVTVSSSNGWNTNFDDLVFDGGVTAPGVPSPSPSPTPVAPQPTSVPTTAPATTTSITFDNLTNPNRALNGQYPTSQIDWGTNRWYLSGPYGQMRTQSIGFNGAGPTSASFTFVSPKTLVKLDAFNGGRTASTVTLSCAGQPTVSVSLAAGQLQTIQTSWTAACSSVTVTSSNGWDTNFDTLVIK